MHTTVAGSGVAGGCLRGETRGGDDGPSATPAAAGASADAEPTTWLASLLVDACMEKGAIHTSCTCGAVVRCYHDVGGRCHILPDDIEDNCILFTYESSSGAVVRGKCLQWPDRSVPWLQAQLAVKEQKVLKEQQKQATVRNVATETGMPFGTSHPRL